MQPKCLGVCLVFSAYGVQSLDAPQTQTTSIALSIYSVHSKMHPRCKRIHPALKLSRESYLDAPLDCGSPAKSLHALVYPKNPSLYAPEIVRDPSTLPHPGSTKPGYAFDNKCPAWYLSCFLCPWSTVARCTPADKASSGFVYRESITQIHYRLQKPSWMPLRS